MRSLWLFTSSNTRNTIPGPGPACQVTGAPALPGWPARPAVRTRSRLPAATEPSPARATASWISLGYESRTRKESPFASQLLPFPGPADRPYTGRLFKFRPSAAATAWAEDHRRRLTATACAGRYPSAAATSNPAAPSVLISSERAFKEVLRQATLAFVARQEETCRVPAWVRAQCICWISRSKACWTPCSWCPSSRSRLLCCQGWKVVYTT